MSSSVHSQPSPDSFDRPETEISDAWRMEGPQRRRNRKEIPPELLDDRMISADQWAAACGVSKRQIFRWQDAGRMPAPDLRIDQVVRWKLGTLRAWMDSQNRR
jgi:predicted DNA-binding transcriptional regulator AlpA